MQIHECIAQLNSELDALDVDAMPGDVIADFMDVLVPLSRRLTAFVSVLGARGVEINRHNVESSRSGASWIADRTGLSERQARSALALHKELSSLPDVEQSFRAGDISVDAAAAIVRNSESNPSVAQQLLDVARNSSLDALHQHVRNRQARESSAARFERLRKSQFVSLSVDKDSMFDLHMKLRPSLGAPLANLIRNTNSENGWQRAESIAQQLNECLVGSTNGRMASNSERIVFHIDLLSAGTFDGEARELHVGKKARIKGVGVVHRDELLGHLANASRALVGTIDNKLVWFSEQRARSKDTPLPEFIKRAIKASSWDTCDAPGCDNPAEQVDHIIAKCNDGGHSIDNLQSLCGPDHHAKTKVDAPWTTGGIYGKSKAQRQSDKTRQASNQRSTATDLPKPRVRHEQGEPPDSLFPDTG